MVSPLFTIKPRHQLVNTIGHSKERITNKKEIDSSFQWLLLKLERIKYRRKLLVN